MLRKFRDSEVLTGRRFRISKATLALEATENERRVVTIPEGAIVRVLSGPSRIGDTGTVSIEWEGRTVAMFAVDVEARGTEVKDKSVGA
jgi:hypothetical protein